MSKSSVTVGVTALPQPGRAASLRAVILGGKFMALKPIYAAITVTTAGTRAQVSTTDKYASCVRFEADGTSTLYVGDSTVSATAYSAKIVGGSAVNAWQLNADGQSSVNETMINLKYFYVDAGANGAKVHVTYFDRVGSY